MMAADSTCWYRGVIRIVSIGESMWKHVKAKVPSRLKPQAVEWNKTPKSQPWSKPCPSAHKENAFLLEDVHSEFEHTKVGEMIASGHDVTLDDKNYEAISKPLSVLNLKLASQQLRRRLASSVRNALNIQRNQLILFQSNPVSQLPLEKVAWNWFLKISIHMDVRTLTAMWRIGRINSGGSIRPSGETIQTKRSRVIAS